MAEEKTENTPPAEAAPASGGGNKLVLILTAVNLLVTVGIIALLFISFKKDSTQPTVTDIAVESDEEGGHGGGGGHGQAAGGHGGGHGGGDAAAKDHGKTKSSEFGKMVTLEQFTVNLSTPGSTSPKYVRVNISVEVPNGDVENEVNLKMPQVRNVVIDLFNSKRPTDLGTAEGREYLKEEIKNALNTVLVSGKIKGVFFTNFTLTS